MVPDILNAIVRSPATTFITCEQRDHLLHACQEALQKYRHVSRVISAHHLVIVIRRMHPFLLDLLYSEAFAEPFSEIQTGIVAPDERDIECCSWALAFLLGYYGPGNTIPAMDLHREGWACGLDVRNTFGIRLPRDKQEQTVIAQYRAPNAAARQTVR